MPGNQDVVSVSGGCTASGFVSGLIILGQGIYEFWHPGTTVLANLHPAFWWGMLMTAFGSFYTIRFRPGKG